jgi:hypothetical protein
LFSGCELGIGLKPSAQGAAAWRDRVFPIALNESGQAFADDAAASADDHSLDFATLNESVNFGATASLSSASIAAGPYCGSILTAV